MSITCVQASPTILPLCLSFADSILRVLIMDLNMILPKQNVVKTVSESSLVEDIHQEQTGLTQSSLEQSDLYPRWHAPQSSRLPEF